VDDDEEDDDDVEDDDAIPYFWGVLAIMGGCSFVIPDAMIGCVGDESIFYKRVFCPKLWRL